VLLGYDFVPAGMSSNLVLVALDVKWEWIVGVVSSGSEGIGVFGVDLPASRSVTLIAGCELGTPEPTLVFSKGSPPLPGIGIVCNMVSDFVVTTGVGSDSIPSRNFTSFLSAVTGTL
jgi:hypothetical protein